MLPSETEKERTAQPLAIRGPLPRLHFFPALDAFRFVLDLAGPSVGAEIQGSLNPQAAALPPAAPRRRQGKTSTEGCSAEVAEGAMRVCFTHISPLRKKP